MLEVEDEIRQVASAILADQEPVSYYIRSVSCAKDTSGKLFRLTLSARPTWPAEASIEETTGHIFERANEMREAKGCRPFIRDARLDKAAQKHADDMSAGRARPHDELRWRIYEYAGFPEEPCHISRKAMMANYTEGIVGAGDSVGPDTLKILTHFGPGEGHYDDFYDPKIQYVGIGVSDKNHLVLDYGVLCSVPPEPEPKAPDRESFDLW